MMFNHNRLCLLILVFALALSATVSAQADCSYISIQEMRDNVPSSWTESLKGGKKDFECTIDAPIVVPEVDRFPVLKVACQGEIPGIEETGYYIENYTERELMVKTIPDSEKEPIEGSDFQEIYDNEAMDEESLNQAEEKARKILQGIWNLGGAELERTGVGVFCGTETTYREITVDFCPVYNGIPYLKCPYSIHGLKNVAARPDCYAYVFWEEETEYQGAYLFMPRLIGEEVADVPLLPFSEIEKIIRQRIQEGYIQSICEIRLGYICGNDADHPGEAFYLTPAWVVCGVMNVNPNIPFYPQNYQPPSRYHMSHLMINAQTGEIIDENSRSKETFDAHILTWDDVKK
ncbi:MAG: hypothetical protein IKZ98_03915 [Clostridia bacterium]|nr:hypothetical protein [Clostridia bacterium]